MLKKIFAILTLLISCCAYATHWVQPDYGLLPLHPFLVGFEKNGTPLYLCQAFYNGGDVAGKTWQHPTQCNIAFGGKEIQIKAEFLVYNKTRSGGNWVFITNGKIPADALIVGSDANGKPFYLCHAHFAGSLQPGETAAGSATCNIAYKGKEYLRYGYAVFVQSKHHQRLHPLWPPQHCIMGPLGDKACGYDCIKSLDAIACAPKPDEMCMASDFGQIACGYHCAKTTGAVQCASNKSQHCVSNQFGDIRCGAHCHVDRFGGIEC